MNRQPPQRPMKGDGTHVYMIKRFNTIQGEGPYSGRAAHFIRLAGCNLQCYFCDTKYMIATKHGYELPTPIRVRDLVDDIYRAIDLNRLIVITGGEPLNQNIWLLVTSLLRKGYKIQIETNGTRWCDLPASPNLHITCSPKTPLLNRRLITYFTANKAMVSFKYVVAHGQPSITAPPAEGSYIRDARAPIGHRMCSSQQTSKKALASPIDGIPVYVQPLDAGDKASRYKHMQWMAKMVQDNPNLIASLQIHKFIGVE